MMQSFLHSGNGPLVNILREALARDEVRRIKEGGGKLKKGEAMSKVKALIQNVHNFRDECLKDSQKPSPQPSPGGRGGERYVVEVHGFDYFDTAKGELVSGGKGKIAMWLLDTDYDERSLFPRQVFFPMAGKGEGWEKLKKNIRAELNEALLDKFHGTKSLPFEAGENRKVAVKIVDDRGIESLKVLPLN